MHSHAETKQQGKIKYCICMCLSHKHGLLLSSALFMKVIYITINSTLQTHKQRYINKR